MAPRKKMPEHVKPFTTEALLEVVRRSKELDRALHSVGLGISPELKAQIAESRRVDHKKLAKAYQILGLGEPPSPEARREEGDRAWACVGRKFAETDKRISPKKPGRPKKSVTARDAFARLTLDLQASFYENNEPKTVRETIEFILRQKDAQEFLGKIGMRTNLQDISIEDLERDVNKRKGGMKPT